MSGGSHHPLTCCDRDCAGANGCGHLGGTQCESCGLYYCSMNIGEDGLCETCAAEREEEERIERQEAEGAE